MKRIMKTYDLNEEQRRVVEEKLRALLEICQIHEIPMFATVAVKNTENETEYNNIVYGAKANKISLADDQIRHHILIATGFVAVPERERFSMPDLAKLSNSGEDLLTDHPVKGISQ